MFLCIRSPADEDGVHDSFSQLIQEQCHDLHDVIEMTSFDLEEESRGQITLTRNCPLRQEVTSDRNLTELFVFQMTSCIWRLRRTSGQTAMRRSRRIIWLENAGHLTRSKSCPPCPAAPSVSVCLLHVFSVAPDPEDHRCLSSMAGVLLDMFYYFAFWNAAFKASKQQKYTVWNSSSWCMMQFQFMMQHYF